MNPWRTYADAPAVDPDLTRAERRQRGRAARDGASFAESLASGGTGWVVWMCADALGAVDAEGRPVLDAVHVDEALPGPWEWDLVDLARRVAPEGGRRLEALAEGYQTALADLAEEPLHSVRSAALRHSRRLAADVGRRAAASADTAVRRLVSPTASLRRDRVARHWDVDAVAAIDIAQEMAQYRESVPESTALLLAQYRVHDALASGDGRLMVLLARGTDAEDVLLLEATPAGPSARESSVGAWRDGSDVQRVLLVRESVPLVPVEYTGWSTSADGLTARAWSRARLAQQEPDLGSPRAGARRLGAALGLLHGAGSDAAFLSGYLGRSRRFAVALREHVESLHS